MSKDSREATESAAGAALRMARAELVTPRDGTFHPTGKDIRKAAESAAGAALRMARAELDVHLCEWRGLNWYPPQRRRLITQVSVLQRTRT